MLRRHFQLSQDLTLFRLTILAGIFLPLSFAASLFGMNVRNIDDSIGPMKFSKWTNATIIDLPDDVHKQTAALISTPVAVSDTSNYSWPTFVGSVADLVLILLPTLAIGSIIRVIVVSITKYAVYWRVFTISRPCVGLALVVTSVWGTVLGHFFEIRYVYTAQGGFMLEFFIAYMVCNGLLLLTECWQMYRGWTSKQRPVFWTTLMILTALCFGLDMAFWRTRLLNSYDQGYGDRLQVAYRDVLRAMLLPWLLIGIDLIWCEAGGGRNE